MPKHQTQQIDKQALIDVAEAVGEECADKMYRDMLDPKTRGTKFRWDFLPTMCGSYAASSMSAYLTDETDATLVALIRDIAQHTAIAAASKIIVKEDLRG